MRKVSLPLSRGVKEKKKKNVEILKIFKANSNLIIRK